MENRDWLRGRGGETEWKLRWGGVLMQGLWQESDLLRLWKVVDAVGLPSKQSDYV